MINSKQVETLEIRKNLTSFYKQAKQLAITKEDSLKK